MAALRTYRARRDFAKTAEPIGGAGRRPGRRYVVQKHAARRLHYDLRLELDGAMLSWAVTRGPSLVPGDKRLAIHVEDHPVEYNKFEGTIPKGEYGGGTVMIWDRGQWIPEGDPQKGLKKGHLDFELRGKKLKGRWHLVRMRKRTNERQEPWLLIKSHDTHARNPSDPDVLEQMPDSVASGRSMSQIAAATQRTTKAVKTKARRTQKVKSKRKLASASAPAARGARRNRRGRAPGRQRKTKSADDGAAGSAIRAAGPPPFVPPSLATLAGVAPTGGRWVHEIKFDGYRIQARIAKGGVSLRTRNWLDWTERFPGIATALRALADRDAILDGEAVSADRNGVSDFSALQADLKSGRGDRIVYYAFDLLHLDGRDLVTLPLIERKRLLARVLAPLPGDGRIRLSEHFETDGALMLKSACKLGLEGIVSKRSDAPYRSGRVRDWLKTKCIGSQEFVVAGYELSDKPSRAIRSLLLAYREGDKLRYAGRVGTGWSAAEDTELSQRLAPSIRRKPPFDAMPAAERRRKAIWTKPDLVVEVQFRGWTGDGLIRQGSFKGIREDKPPSQAVPERAVMPLRSNIRPSKPKQAAKQAALQKRQPKKSAVARPARTAPVAIAGVRLTHPDRVYWTEPEVTKRALAEYYADVWDWIRPHVTGRVLALVRCPEGAGTKCFFQKHASAGIDTEHLRLVREPGGDKSISIDRLSGLVTLAQAGVLEIHRRGSTAERLEEANHLVFDLDPGPGMQWKDVVAAAREVRERLERGGLAAFAMSTGGNGLHVIAPIRFAPWDAVKAFCRGVAQDMEQDAPSRYTANVRRSARRNRIFVDYLRNTREATAISPYSTRARPGATVAVPLAWDELSARKADNTFDVEGVRRRLSRLRQDPWKDIARMRRKLPAG